MISSEFGMEDIIVDLLNSLSAVKDLSELSPHAGNEKELISKALSVLIQNQDMERCSLFLLNEQGYLVNLTGVSSCETASESRLEYKSLQFKVGEGVIGIAAQTGELQYCEDCSIDERFSSDKPQDNVELPGSVISVPIIVDNDVVGVLNISHPQANYFNEWHIRMLSIYKNMLGQLIINYRLFQQMDAEIYKRTAKLEKALVDLNSLKEHFENMSMVDQLTGLFNRHYFYSQAEIAIANTKRYGQALCLLVLDLDRFKDVNDQYGHGFGDDVLVKAASVMKEQVRDSDVLVRYGGEEFVVVFTNTTCENGKLFAERIREKIASIAWDEEGFQQTVSIGLYCLTDCGEPNMNVDINIDKIINFADIALYQAKAQGRNKVITFNEDMLEK